MFLPDLARVSSVLASLTTVAAADVLTVGPAGSGAQFTQIQAAADAAQNDDVILVKPGTYQPIVVTKPVRILADGTGSVRTAATIRDIAAAEEMILSGVDADVLLADCAGTVVLEGIDIFGEEFAPAVRVQNCRRVLLLGSSITRSGRHGPSRTGAVVAQGSELWVVDTQVSGSSDCCFAESGAHGIELDGCTLHVWRSRIRSGSGAAKQDGRFADGGTAIKAVASTVNLFG